MLPSRCKPRAKRDSYRANHQDGQVNDGSDHERSPRQEASDPAVAGAGPFIAACSAKDLRGLDAIGVETEVAEGRVLTREGQRGREWFIVFEGVAVVQQDGCPLGVVGPGSIIGEMALVGGIPRTATVVAGTPMRLLVLTQAEFRHITEVSPTIASGLRQLAEVRSSANAVLTGSTR